LIGSDLKLQTHTKRLTMDAVRHALRQIPDTSAPTHIASRQFGTGRELVLKCHGTLRHQYN